MSALTRQTLPAISHKPRLAVFKFASCDGCQLSLLDCEDELSSIAGRVEIAYFLEATSKVELGPYDIALVEGSITTPHDALRIEEVRRQSQFLVTIGACATAGGIQALRNWADHKDFLRCVYARPDYIETSGHLDGHRRSRAGRLRAARLSHQPPSACRSAAVADFWKPAAHTDAQRLPRLQAAGNRLRDGCAGDSLPGARHAIGLRSDLPLLRPRAAMAVSVRPHSRTATASRIISSRRERHWGRSFRFCGTTTPRPPPSVRKATASRRPRTHGPSRNRSSEERPVTKTRTIKVDALSRVEGEGGLHVAFEGDAVAAVRLSIYEPPRFFEAFLRGRPLGEVPDIVARICGICPVAYQMSSVHALERALGITIGPDIRRLRRLLYCGEWIESHALHIHLLHAPDFFGCEAAWNWSRFAATSFSAACGSKNMATSYWKCSAAGRSTR